MQSYKRWLSSVDMLFHRESVCVVGDGRRYLCAPFMITASVCFLRIVFMVDLLPDDDSCEKVARPWVMPRCLSPVG